MEARTLSKLEFNKILNMLAGFTSFACSREMAEQLLPAEGMAEAVARQEQTDEARDILRHYPTFSLGGLRDIRGYLQHVSIGGVLDVSALIDITDICRSARLAKVFFAEMKGSYPIISSLGKSLSILKTIETAVEKSIEGDGSISDNASDRLYQIRRKKRAANERIKERLETLIKNPNTQKYLQEPIVTIRDNRYVVPVKMEYRQQVPGAVHDMSASGASVFIEPMAVMELNNELQKLDREETEEIEAILRALSIMVASFGEDLQNNLDRLTRLDFFFAKAKLSYEMDGVAPKINDKGFIRLHQVRHPLIPKEVVVPVTIRLDKDLSAMVITGPNTGGKTVTLKTVGLLTLMGLAGLHIPCESGSEISFFNQVFADIGDEQSIEQSLSTFSSHMKNIVDILAKADRHSLVLLDELGAGTDPTEGATLAMAILDALKRQGAKIVATTHYSELKAFAYNNPGFINASVEFDVISLAPTYKLLMGVPGKSNAFEIARRLGLSDTVIDAASDFLSAKDAQVADLLANLEDMRRQVAAANEEVEKREDELAAKEKSLIEREQKMEINYAELVREANLKSQKIIDETLSKSEKIYREMQEKLAEEKTAEKAWQQAKKEFKDWQRDLEESLPQKVYEGNIPKKIETGMRVFIPRLNQTGFVLAPPDTGGEVALQVGVLRLMVAKEDLRQAPDEQPQKKKATGARTGNMQIEKARGVKNEIDLRGCDTAEALELLDKYLDDAFVAGLPMVRIIHGKGTGVLRAQVAKYLQGHLLVKSFEPGGYHDGGIGVTIAHLNQ